MWWWQIIVFGETEHSIQLPYIDFFGKNKIVKQTYKTIPVIFRHMCVSLCQLTYLHYIASISLPATKPVTLDEQHKQPLSIPLLPPVAVYNTLNNLAISYLYHLNSWVSSTCLSAEFGKNGAILMLILFCFDLNTFPCFTSWSK